MLPGERTCRVDAGAELVRAFKAVALGSGVRVADPHVVDLLTTFSTPEQLAIFSIASGFLGFPTTDVRLGGDARSEGLLAHPRAVANSFTRGRNDSLGLTVFDSQVDLCVACLHSPSEGRGSESRHAGRAQASDDPTSAQVAGCDG